MTADELAKLHAAAFTRLRPWTASEFETLLESPHSILVNPPHAFAVGRIVCDEAELLTIATDPEHRRSGHGRTALAAFEARASERGATTAFLEVDAENQAAIRLYTQAGYREIARRGEYYRLRNGSSADALVLRKALA